MEDSLPSTPVLGGVVPLSRRDANSMASPPLSSFSKANAVREKSSSSPACRSPTLAALQVARAEADAALARGDKGTHAAIMAQFSRLTLSSQQKQGRVSRINPRNAAAPATPTTASTAQQQQRRVRTPRSAAKSRNMLLIAAVVERQRQARVERQQEGGTTAPAAGGANDGQDAAVTPPAGGHEREAHAHKHAPLSAQKYLRSARDRYVPPVARDTTPPPLLRGSTLEAASTPTIDPPSARVASSLGLNKARSVIPEDFKQRREQQRGQQQVWSVNGEDVTPEALRTADGARTGVGGQASSGATGADAPQGTPESIVQSVAAASSLPPTPELSTPPPSATVTSIMSRLNKKNECTTQGSREEEKLAVVTADTTLSDKDDLGESTGKSTQFDVAASPAPPIEIALVEDAATPPSRPTSAGSEGGFAADSTPESVTDSGNIGGSDSGTPELAPNTSDAVAVVLRVPDSDADVDTLKDFVKHAAPMLDRGIVPPARENADAQSAAERASPMMAESVPATITVAKVAVSPSPVVDGADAAPADADPFGFGDDDWTTGSNYDFDRDEDDRTIFFGTASARSSARSSVVFGLGEPGEPGEEASDDEEEDEGEFRAVFSTVQTAVTEESPCDSFPAHRSSVKQASRTGESDRRSSALRKQFRQSVRLSPQQCKAEASPGVKFEFDPPSPQKSAVVDVPQPLFGSESDDESHLESHDGDTGQWFALDGLEGLDEFDNDDEEESTVYVPPGCLASSHQ